MHLMRCSGVAPLEPLRSPGMTHDTRTTTIDNEVVEAELGRFVGLLHRVLDDERIPDAEIRERLLLTAHGHGIYAAAGRAASLIA
jgi:hypothetical protein